MVNLHCPMVEIPIHYIPSPKTQSVDLLCFSILIISRSSAPKDDSSHFLLLALPASAAFSSQLRHGPPEQPRRRSEAVQARPRRRPGFRV